MFNTSILPIFPYKKKMKIKSLGLYRFNHIEILAIKRVFFERRYRYYLFLFFIVIAFHLVKNKIK